MNLNIKDNHRFLVKVALHRYKLKKDAAKALGITTKTLRGLIRDYGIKVILVLLCTACSTACSKPVYQTGTLTKGNPDNSYLDSCDIYCCGD